MAHNKPALRVTIDGTDLTDRLSPRLLSLSIGEKRGGEADQLDLVFHDHDGVIALPREGAIIAVSMGWESGPDVTPGLVDKGSFRVDEVEYAGPPDIITVRARSADLTARYRQRQEESWRDTTLGDVIREIAHRNGLGTRMTGELNAIAIPVLVNDQRSDMALVRHLGERYDATATVKNGQIVFLPIGAGQTGSGSAIPALSLTRRDGDKFVFRRAARDQHNGVEARYHDQDSAERRTVTAGGGTGEGAPRRLRRTYASEADAQAAADSEASRIERAAAEFDYTLAFGDPAIYPERPVSLSGFKPEIDGMAWLIAEATHELGNAGLTTRLKLEVRS